eukprot:GGOE01053363.1.p1 GENE.GGOE01053363.1~~GGOE01053363.1.p1  ORF type:complete len:695 (-),score=97.85 GGOE01053363.1:415-2412(-)
MSTTAQVDNAAEEFDPGQVVVTDHTPVFSGPIYNLDSLDDLPEPIESHQQLEHLEGDESDPFSAHRYRLITTHILPPVVVYAPPARLTIPDGETPTIRQRREQKLWQHSLGELTLDPLAPDGIAVKLLLLEAQAPFVIHEVDPISDSNVKASNPHGKVPYWVDADGSCIWEAHSIMRYVNDKHILPDSFYFADEGPMKWRTDMALDWCQQFLAVHIKQVLHPEIHEHEDLSDIPGGPAALEKDFKVLTDYFLRETPFIGGPEPNIADYSICMHLLMLYSTRTPPPDRVRQYLHNAAEHVEHWNDATLPIREFCMLRQRELREADSNFDKVLLEDDRLRRKEYFAQLEHEDVERRAKQEGDQRSLWETEERRREAEDQRRRQEQDRQMKEEWEMKRRLLEERHRKNEEDRRRAEEELHRLEDEKRRQEEEERRWQEEYEGRMQPFKLRKNSANSMSMRPQVGVEIKMLDDTEGRPDCIVVVERVVADGPAQRAGLKAEDIIDRWNGERLYSKEQWAEKVKNSKIGEQVTLTIYRGSLQEDFVVTIGGTSKATGSVRKVVSKTQVAHNIRYDKPPSTAVSNSNPKGRSRSSSRNQSITSHTDLPREISAASSMRKTVSRSGASVRSSIAQDDYVPLETVEQRTHSSSRSSGMNRSRRDEESVDMMMM